ncbi:hypothetical protein ACE1CI_03960 [Aerosakkonemataceae cyanobacterium BLCC-F50]|uniref:DUF7689 domain-containing protein n=1 Tax=Floridaenema flaviceps BLCC-F50 TaxID=3153642 RepID=A0ABV4XM69_9CYAN
MDLIKLELKFPNLRKTGYKKTSDQTAQYNCIAWVAGVKDRPWWPINQKPYYWPLEPRIESLESFIEAFKTLGYEICDNGDLEVGYEKVAIYTDEGEPTHMALQLDTGEWTSKCGDWEDITHTLEGLEGDFYGKVSIFMRRLRLESKGM